MVCPVKYFPTSARILNISAVGGHFEKSQLLLLLRLILLVVFYFISPVNRFCVVPTCLWTEWVRRSEIFVQTTIAMHDITSGTHPNYLSSSQGQIELFLLMMAIVVLEYAFIGSQLLWPLGNAHLHSLYRSLAWFYCNSCAISIGWVTSSYDELGRYLIIAIEGVVLLTPNMKCGTGSIKRNDKHLILLLFLAIVYIEINSAGTSLRILPNL